MIDLVKIVSATPTGDYRVRIAFSNGDVGERDFADVVSEGGPMIAPLVDKTYFARLFVQSGVLAWPNGLDLDAIALHQEMQAAGTLRRQQPAAE